MRQTPLLTFTSSAFAVVPGEDEYTNPGIYGQALAQWIAERLRARGLDAGDAFAEDFGWCVPVRQPPHVIHVACAGDEDREFGWQVFCFVEDGLLARIRRRGESAEALARVFGELKDTLAAAPEVKDLGEERDA